MSERAFARLGKAAAVLGLAAAPLLLGEGAARLVHTPEPLRRVADPFAYRIPAPNLVDRFVNRDGETIEVRLNELGMRGPSLAEAVAPGTFTVVFLGGSTTENYAFPREDTFPELVGRAVGARLGRPVRVFNAGASAATSGVTLGRLQQQVLDLDPDLVVVLDGINDLLSGFRSDFRRDGRHLPPAAPAGTHPRSYLLDWLRHLRPRRSLPAPPAPDFALDDFSAFPARAVFARNLRSIAAIARAHRVPALFLTQPSQYLETPRPGDAERFVLTVGLAGRGRVPDVPTLARGLRAMNAEVLGLADFGGGVEVFDLAARLPPSWELFVDECHFTRAGNARVAAELVPVIEALLLQAQARGSSS